MKKMFVLIPLIVLFSCEPNTEKPIKTIQTFGNGYIQIYEIDGCEYVLTDVDGGSAICHKGNCKYCIERSNNGEK